MKSVWFSSAVLLAVASLSRGDDSDAPVKSGLQPGDPAGAFNVLDITGPNKGKKLCYR